MKYLAIFLIKFYQQTEPIRSQLYVSMGISSQACRQSPTCSRYTIEAIQRYGTMHGVVLGLKRIVTCHQFSHQHVR